MSLSPCNACTVRSRGRHAKHGHRWGETPRPTDGFEARRCQYGFAHGFKGFKIRGSGASGYIHGTTAWEIFEFHFVLFTCYRSNRIRTQPRNPEGPSTPYTICYVRPYQVYCVTRGYTTKRRSVDIINPEGPYILPLWN